MSNNVNNQFAQAFEQARGDKKQQQQQTHQGNNDLGIVPQFDAIGGLGMRGFGADNNGGETYELFMKIGQEIVEKQNKRGLDCKFAIHRVMKEGKSLNYSNIVISCTASGITTYHTLLLEVTGNITDVTRDFNGEKFLIIRPASMALNDAYTRIAQQVVSRDLRVDPSTLRTVDGLVVTKAFDGSNEEAIRQLLSISFNATYCEAIVLTKDHYGRAISTFTAKKDARFAADITFMPDDHMAFDLTGSPIRRDISIRVSTKEGDDKNNNINQGDVGEDIVEIFGYMDFQYQSPKPQPNGYISKQCARPEFVVTSIHSPSVLVTPTVLVMALASLATISEDSTWAKYFIDRTPIKGKTIDLNDIGNLNVIANLNNVASGEDKPFDTKGSNLGPSGLLNYINLVTYPEILISIDIPQAGVDTWFMGILKAVAGHNVSARQRISEAVNVLVGGGYQDTGEPMFLDISNNIHGGYYVEKGTMYDIRRETSLLAFIANVQNQGRSNTLIYRFINTFQQQAIPSDIRAAERLKLIEKSVQVSQYYERFTFNGSWFTNLVRTLSAAGFKPMPENYHLNHDVFQSSGFNYMSGSIDPNVRITGQSNMFGNYTQQNYNTGRVW